MLATAEAAVSGAWDVLLAEGPMCTDALGKFKVSQ